MSGGSSYELLWMPSRKYGIEIWSSFDASRKCALLWLNDALVTTDQSSHYHAGKVCTVLLTCRRVLHLISRVLLILISLKNKLHRIVLLPVSSACLVYLSRLPLSSASLVCLSFPHRLVARLVCLSFPHRLVACLLFS
jgi:hypothetical protein